MGALIFVSTVLKNNIAYSIQCIACFDLCINSVNKQYTIELQCSSNIKSSDYVKIRLKGLIYFELQQTSNYIYFKLDNS